MLKTKNFKSYIPVILFTLLILSPLISTGLSLKKYTRLNEILILVIIMFSFMSSAVSHKPFSLKKIEQLLLLMGLSLTFSTIYGYLFLDIIVSPLDFYPIFNIILFMFYFRCGTFFIYKPFRSSIVHIILFTSIFAYNILHILSIFPWGWKFLMPYFIPESKYNQLQFFIDSHFYIGTQRIIGTMGNANSTSVLTIILLCLLISWVIYMPTRGFLKKTMLYVLLLLTILTLLLSFSRTGIISFTVAITCFLFPSILLKKRTIILSTILILVGSSSIVIMETTNRFFIIPYDHLRGLIPDVSGFYANISSIQNRLDLWMQGLEKYSLSPVFGTGTANATNALNAKLGISTVESFYSPHNEYINLLIKSGIFGLFFYLLLFITVFKKANIVLKNNTNEFSLFIAHSVKTIIIALAVFNFAVGFWDNNVIPALLMVLFGTMYASDYKMRV